MAADDVIAETDRVVLRPWQIEEADRFFDMHRRMEVARWIGGRPMVDLEEAVRLIERISDELADDPRFGSWASLTAGITSPPGCSGSVRTPGHARRLIPMSQLRTDQFSSASPVRPSCPSLSTEP